MRSTKGAFLIAVVGSLVAGSFIAWPELRASASFHPVTSDEIQDNTIQSVDIKDRTIKATDIATNTITASEIRANSVGGSELIGVTELLFEKCDGVTFDGDPVSIPAGATVAVLCDGIFGADSTDAVIATLNTSDCLVLMGAYPLDFDAVQVNVKNECDTDFGPSTLPIGVIVFNT